eukprot:TRINITY_DN4037_c0_g1_i1.p1 TRINITY_DN4037_c0_g1~~TRINITY_DN4037_c0_g1_i1.p1  ORF type:complete len:319 (+),score=47.28 TRINITY_DN4037_c0_g1_i1:141-959(+)
MSASESSVSLRSSYYSDISTDVTFSSDGEDMFPLDVPRRGETIYDVDAYFAARQINFLEYIEDAYVDDDDADVALDRPQRAVTIRDLDAFLAARQINFSESSGDDEHGESSDDDADVAPDRPQRAVTIRDVVDAFLAARQINLSVSEGSGDDESDRRPSLTSSDSLDLGEHDAMRPRLPSQECSRGEDRWTGAASRFDFGTARMHRCEADEAGRSEAHVEQAGSSSFPSSRHLADAAVTEDTERASERANKLLVPRRESIIQIIRARRASTK